MKTAMQELLENLQKSFDEKTYPIRIDATYSLEKEKVQFHDMFEEGFESAYQYFVNGKDFVKFEEYYNQTYNQTNVGNDGFEFDNSSTIPPPKTNNL